MTKQQKKAEERRTKIAELAKQGLGNAEIAQRLGLGSSYVGAVRKELGLSTGKRGRPDLAFGAP